MNKYFFYTDPTKVKNQTQSQAFGPVTTGDGDLTAGKDKYRITNLHTTDTSQPDPAPAIAICDGMICVQEDSPTTYSIILKPNYQPPFDFPFIKYFIYKGIKKDSIVNGTSVDFSKETEIPFIKDIFKSWDPEIVNNTDTIANSKDVLGLAYDDSVSHTIDNNPTFIFEDDQPIDNLFYYPSPDFQLPSVKAGDKIGEFATEFGFEIVLERLGYEPKISLARTFENFIEVNTIPDPFNTAGIPVNDANYFFHWHDKEECLNYIDPCAFYGSFCGSKVFIGGGNKPKCNSPKEIYDEILDKAGFLNKNKIYIDIRNDYGYSLNYFKDYGKIILFSKEDKTSTFNFNICRNLWPLLKIEKTDFVTTTFNKESIEKIFLTLPKGDNEVAAIYSSRTYNKKLKTEKSITFIDRIDNVNELELYELYLVTNKDKSKLISNYYKINLYDLHGNHTNGITPSKRDILNGVFRPLDLINSINFNNNWYSTTKIHKDELVIFSKYFDPHIGNIGLTLENNMIILFTVPYSFIEENTYETNLTSFCSQTSNNNIFFSNRLIKNNSNNKYFGHKIEISNSSTNNIIEKIDGVVTYENHFNNDFINDFVNINTNQINFLIFSKPSFQAIIDFINSANFILKLPIYLQVRSSKIKSDINNALYNEVELELQGYKLSLNKVEKEVISINQKIYDNDL